MQRNLEANGIYFRNQWTSTLLPCIVIYLYLMSVALTLSNGSPGHSRKFKIKSERQIITGVVIDNCGQPRFD